MRDLAARRIAAGAIVLALAVAAPSHAATWYVDSSSGSDANDGRSAASAWQTLDKVNATTFAPGDVLRFRSGASWKGRLAPRGSGAAGNPIAIDRYGDGALPSIDGAGGDAALYLRNQDQWEIRNLDLTNDAPDAGSRHGVLVVAESPGRVLRHIRLSGLQVHDVRGRLGAQIEDKTTGGIGFQVRGPFAAQFDDLVVEGCTIRSVDDTGLYIWSESSPHPRDAAWESTRITNVRIVRNRLIDIGKNAMAIRAAEAPLIEGNYVDGAAARVHGNAIYVFGCRNAVIQLNEVTRTRYDGLEGAAFDSDYNCEGTVIQYNYSHANGGGLVNLCNNPDSRPPRGYNDGTIVRYNVSENETKRVIGFDGPVTNTKIYNNTIYLREGLSPRIIDFDLFGKAPGYASGTWFANNIVVNLGAGTYRWGEATGFRAEQNCFYGNHPSGEPTGPGTITADPLLAAPGTGSADGYRLKESSPCRDTGAAVESNGRRDYWGNPLYRGQPDRGAHELAETPAKRRAVQP